MFLAGYCLEQPVADGAHDRDRLRRRRRDGGAGEHRCAIASRACRRRQAALEGAREVGFTVLSISVSLIAVFIPILLMGGIVGRLFREFAVDAVGRDLVSLLVSLTTTPMMCALLLRARKHGAGEPGAASRAATAAGGARVRAGMPARLRRGRLDVAPLRHARLGIGMIVLLRGDDRPQRLPLRHRFPRVSSRGRTQDA